MATVGMSKTKHSGLLFSLDKGFFYLSTGNVFIKKLLAGFHNASKVKMATVLLEHITGGTYNISILL